MRKNIIILVVLFCSSFVFAETKFMGIPFGITYEEITNKKYETELEEKIKKNMSDYCRDASVEVGYNLNGKSSQIRIRLETYYNEQLYKIVQTYFLENGYKQNAYFYNQDFVILVGYDSKYIIIEVFDKSSFLSKFKTLFQ